MNASMHSCIPISIYSFLYSYLFISFIHFFHNLAILVLSIFLSCRLLLIHIFIYVPIIYANVLIPMLCHLLLISIVLIIYAFLSCVPSTFHLIPFPMSMISHLIHIFLFLYESILLRNWNQSNRIIQNKVMAFSCQLVILPILLGTVCITYFFGVLTSYLTLYLCTLLNLRF